MNAFHICGGLLAAWAVVVGVLGILRENFPGSAMAARVVGAISVVLVLLAIGTLLYTSANEEEDEVEPTGLVRPA